ncbi:MAG: hypothetical protein AAGG38_02045 [Planctomycetota bacterium]
MTPRNSLIIVRVHRPSETRVGMIVVPKTSNKDYELVEIVSVGRGHLAPDGSYNGTEDLKPGMVVWAKTHMQRPGPAGSAVTIKTSLPITFGEENLEMVNEQDIVAVVAEPHEINPTIPAPGSVIEFNEAS